MRPIRPAANAGLKFRCALCNDGRYWWVRSLKIQMTFEKLENMHFPLIDQGQPKETFDMHLKRNFDACMSLAILSSDMRRPWWKR